MLCELLFLYLYVYIQIHMEIEAVEAAPLTTIENEKFESIFLHIAMEMRFGNIHTNRLLNVQLYFLSRIDTNKNEENY